MKVDWKAVLRNVFLLTTLVSVAKSQITNQNQQPNTTTSKLFLEEGRPCVIEPGKEIGQCKRASRCFKAEELILQGVMPMDCSYLGNEPVVCCRLNSILQDPPTQESLPGENTIRKAMCEDYYKMVQKFDLDDERSEDRYALDGEFPQVVAVGYKQANGSTIWGCTGTLLSDRFVLAAASCAQHFEYGNASTVRLGATNLKENNSLTVEEMVRKVHLRHADTQMHLCDDIALIQLAQPVTFTKYIYPACLPVNTWIAIDVTAAGWGLCEERGDNDFRLRKERLSVYDISDIECQGFGEQKAALNNEDTCKDTFDAGLYIENSPYYYTVHGLSSYAQICITDDENHKIKFTNVGKHVSWIEDKVWPHKREYTQTY